ncbi:U6 snRNA-associated Sm-like protein LSm6 [Metallosphaera javensis (ex Sakai et al. 2022)]|uniref:U6 snRNA-associated Sm-like protein LSm6 n=1 Tax=Metallosphaera javensis (ex Sakai et al. 2022) TaxID=2775498 RepID=UPI0025849058|nr:MAG: putative snRNP Sm-like protein [Metallosphaera javensis (ex Sakai et al. 2022)]
MQAKVENPLKSLRMATNKIVLVKLKDGSEYIGKMEQSDGTMNLVLRDCKEMREGSDEPIANYGRVLIRGSNVLFVSVDYENIINTSK